MGLAVDAADGPSGRRIYLPNSHVLFSSLPCILYVPIDSDEGGCLWQAIDKKGSQIAFMFYSTCSHKVAVRLIRAKFVRDQKSVRKVA